MFCPFSTVFATEVEVPYDTKYMKKRIVRSYGCFVPIIDIQLPLFLKLLAIT